MYKYIRIHLIYLSIYLYPHVNLNVYLHIYAYVYQSINQSIQWSETQRNIKVTFPFKKKLGVSTSLVICLLYLICIFGVQNHNRHDNDKTIRAVPVKCMKKLLRLTWSSRSHVIRSLRLESTKRRIFTLLLSVSLVKYTRSWRHL